MWTGNNLLEMMQRNNELFGDEINHIKAADDEWLIKYFESKLADVLDIMEFLCCKYSVSDSGPHGEPENTRLRKEGFCLTKEQCADIGNYIIGKWHIKRYLNKPTLSRLDSIVVLNYIEHGYLLDDHNYKISYQEPQPSSSTSTFSSIFDGLSELLGSSLKNS